MLFVCCVMFERVYVCCLLSYCSNVFFVLFVCCLIVVPLPPGENPFAVKFNSIQFFSIYVPSQQPQGQLQTEHSVDTGDCIMGKHYINSKTNYRQTLEENTADK
jgi:hypothetical protein